MRFLRKSSLIFVAAFACFSAMGETYPIVKLQNRTEVIAEFVSEDGIKEDGLVIIIGDKDKVLAVGKIRDIERESAPKTMKVEVTVVLENNLILVGDRVALFTKDYLKDHDVPGFNALTLGGSREVESRYKELAYFGVFTAEGHTLDRGEFLLSPFQTQYGINDWVNFKVVNALWFDGYVNAGAKLKVMENKFAKITLNGLGAYKVQRQDWIAQGGGVVTMPTNSKFQSHFMVNFIFDEQSKTSRATENLSLFQTSDIRSITEYMMDNWNRLLYGPVYNVELQTFGGTVSYMWIWKTFHMSLGLATRDFTELSYGTDRGYYYVYDFFLRF